MRTMLEKFYELKVAEADEGGGDPTDNGTLLVGLISVVEHVAHHLSPCEHDAERSGRWDTQMKHGFAAEELSHR